MHYFEAARAPDKTTCENNIEKIAALNPVASEYIRDQPRHDWAMYATAGNVVQDQVTSNMSETANSIMGAEVRLLRLIRPYFLFVTLCLRRRGCRTQLRPTEQVWAK